MLIGYARTSSLQQTNGFGAQLDQLNTYGCEKVYQEQVSAVASRPELEKALDNLRSGDKLVVCKLDRLARSVAHMGKILEEIEAKGAGLVIMSMGNETVDTTTATGKLIVNMMVSVAQFEREMLLERQAEGRARAKAEGKYTGRKKIDKNLINAVDVIRGQGFSVAKACKQVGIGEATYYRNKGLTTAS